MGLVKGQPKVRFSKAGPFGIQGVAIVPKVITFRKTVTGSGTEDFWAAPTGVFITRAMVRVETALNNTGTFEVGTDGNADALIDGADYDEESANAWATNVGSSNADNPNGLYLNAGDNIRITIGGTPDQGVVEGWIEYFELDDIQEEGDFHFDL